MCISLVCDTHWVTVIDLTRHYTGRAFFILGLSNAGLGIHHLYNRLKSIYYLHTVTHKKLLGGMLDIPRIKE